MMSVALATEDEISEAVGEKLILEYPVFADTSIMRLRKNGSGYLFRRMNSWRSMAHYQVMIVLTDLDQLACPLVLLNKWISGNQKLPQNLLLRIAVREIESWLLADHVALIKLFGKEATFPNNPDTLQDPKQHLLKLAKNASRSVKDDLVAQQGAVSIQGIGYNRRLVNWVKEEWCPKRAASLSPSLTRARTAICDAANRAMQA
ncbi:hypothetical protein [Acetobacter thailandicus]|uniref:hypothetical protein n=1 Tax=Acetobacter thailandicus TaxID=1502842 RepID=UPI001BA897E2|nr:hypothetical protein [Acetobacter thailandicus]MBS0981462.1 hypothetical protein [Acetobacter thailandicus]